MPAVTDLTWMQLEAATGNTGFISYTPTDGIVIKPRLLTGDTYPDLSASGVVEFLYKLHLLCASAQSNANTGQPAGERLAAFPPFTATAPVNGFVTVTQQIISRIPLNTNLIVGPNS